MRAKALRVAAEWDFEMNGVEAIFEENIHDHLMNAFRAINSGYRNVRLASFFKDAAGRRGQKK